MKFEVNFFFGNAIKSLGGGGQGGQGRAGGRSDAGSWKPSQVLTMGGMETTELNVKC